MARLQQPPFLFEILADATRPQTAPQTDENSNVEELTAATLYHREKRRQDRKDITDIFYI